MDHVLAALNTLVEVSSMCNWNKLLLYGIDGEGVPVALYYVAVIMLFSFFIMQLFTAVMFTVFTKVRQDISEQAELDTPVSIRGSTQVSSSSTQSIEEREAEQGESVPEQHQVEDGFTHQRHMTAKDKFYARVMRENACMDTCCGLTLLQLWYPNDPKMDDEGKPVEPLQFEGSVAEVVQSNGFGTFIMLCIVVNVIGMASVHERQPDWLLDAQDWGNAFFSVIFLCEMLLKLSFMGGCWYFSDSANCFDAFLVLFSVPDTAAFLFDVNAGGANLTFLRVVRIFKVMRGVRLLHSLEEIALVVLESSRAIANILVFTLFTILIVAIISMDLLAGKMRDEAGSNPRINCDTVGNAALTLFVVLTNENWVDIYHDALDTSALGGAVILLWFGFSTYILMATFAAVILEKLSLDDRHKLRMQVELFLTQEEEERAINPDYTREVKGDRYTKTGECQLANTVEAGEVWIEHNASKSVKEDIVARLRLDVHDYIMPNGEITKWTGEFVPNTCVCVPYHWRKALLKFLVHPVTEGALVVLILISCIMLTLDSPWLHEEVSDTKNAIELFFVLVFTSEMLVKMAAMGIYGSPEAYLSSNWNRLDFICVVASLTSYSARVNGHTRSTASGGMGRSIRALRTLRPLRLINKSEQLRQMFSAIQSAMPTILVVALLSLFCMFLFAIFGMTNFSGKFYFCNDGSRAGRVDCLGTYLIELKSGVGQDPTWAQEGATARLCDGLPCKHAVPRVWANPFYHFDDIFSALFACFTITAIEGWCDILYSATDITGKGIQPLRDNSAAFSLFFVALICLISLFVENIAIGAFIDRFNQATFRGLLTERQKHAKDTLLVIMTQDYHLPSIRPNGTVRGMLYDFMNQPKFEKGIAVLVILQTIIMCTEHFGQPGWLTTALEVANAFFTVLYSLEIGARVMVYGRQIFWRDNFNRLDCFVVLINLFSLPPLFIVSNVDSKTATDTKLILRYLRILFIMRLIKRVKGIRLMMLTLLYSVMEYVNVIAMLFLLLFVYSVVGMQLFGNVRYGKYLGPNVNFRTFPVALITLFRVLTMGPNAIMSDCMVEVPNCTPYSVDLSHANHGHYRPNDCGHPTQAVFFFISFYFFVYYIAANLFVAIVVINFDFCFNLDKNKIKEAVMKNFREAWYDMTTVEVTRRANMEPDRSFDEEFLFGHYLPIGQIRPLMLGAKKPLGSHHEAHIRLVMQEAKLLQTLDYGVHYLTLQQIILTHAVGQHHLEFKEWLQRHTQLDGIRYDGAAAAITSVFRANFVRQKLAQSSQHLLKSVIEVTVLDARNLALDKYDCGSYAGLYCKVVDLDGGVKQTHVCPITTDHGGVWEETTGFGCRYNPLGGKVEVEVWLASGEQGSDELIGTTRLHVRDLAMEEERVKRYPLTPQEDGFDEALDGVGVVEGGAADSRADRDEALAKQHECEEQRQAQRQAAIDRGEFGEVTLSLRHIDSLRYQAGLFIVYL